MPDHNDNQSSSQKDKLKAKDILECLVHGQPPEDIKRITEAFWLGYQDSDKDCK